MGEYVRICQIRKWKHLSTHEDENVVQPVLFLPLILIQFRLKMEKLHQQLTKYHFSELSARCYYFVELFYDGNWSVPNYPEELYITATRVRVKWDNFEIKRICDTVANEQEIGATAKLAISPVDYDLIPVWLCTMG